MFHGAATNMGTTGQQSLRPLTMPCKSATCPLAYAKSAEIRTWERTQKCTVSVPPCLFVSVFLGRYQASVYRNPSRTTLEVAGSQACECGPGVAGVSDGPDGEAGMRSLPQAA